MKPGLWEINNKSGGGQGGEAMAEMPPEQRKQMEAMLAQRGVRMAPGAGGGMTREMAERNEVPTRDGCTSTRAASGSRPTAAT
jgi:hypothetical protein